MGCSRNKPEKAVAAAASVVVYPLMFNHIPSCWSFFIVFWFELLWYFFTPDSVKRTLAINLSYVEGHAIKRCNGHWNCCTLRHSSELSLDFPRDQLIVECRKTITACLSSFVSMFSGLSSSVSSDNDSEQDFSALTCYLDSGFLCL